MPSQGIRRFCVCVREKHLIFFSPIKKRGERGKTHTGGLCEDENEKRKISYHSVCEKSIICRKKINSRRKTFHKIIPLVFAGFDK
jgi:hypothetical protein